MRDTIGGANTIDVHSAVLSVTAVAPWLRERYRLFGRVLCVQCLRCAVLQELDLEDVRHDARARRELRQRRPELFDASWEKYMNTTVAPSRQALVASSQRNVTKSCMPSACNK